MWDCLNWLVTMWWFILEKLFTCVYYDIWWFAFLETRIIHLIEFSFNEISVIKAYVKLISALFYCHRDGARVKRQGESSWIVFARKVRGWTSHCIFKGEKGTRSLSQSCCSNIVSSHAWSNGWSSNISALIKYCILGSPPKWPQLRYFHRILYDAHTSRDMNCTMDLLFKTRWPYSFFFL